MSWLCSLSCSPSKPTWVNEYMFWMRFDIWWMVFILLISENWDGADVELLRIFFLVWVPVFWVLDGFVVLDMKSWGFERMGFVFEDSFKEFICWRMVMPLEFICKFGCCCCCCLFSLFMLMFGLLGKLVFLLFKLVLLLFKLLLIFLFKLLLLLLL